MSLVVNRRIGYLDAWYGHFEYVSVCLCNLPLKEEQGRVQGGENDELFSQTAYVK